MPIPPSPPLDETITPGQSGHIADHEAIAAALNNDTMPLVDAPVVYTVPSPGALVDVGVTLQAAFDNSKVVNLDPNGDYYLNTPIFLDSTVLNDKYVLNANGAKITFGPNLPVASTFDYSTLGISNPPVGFFNGTLRSGLSGGTVTTNYTKGSTSAPRHPRFTINDARLVCDPAAPCVAVFGGMASNNLNGTASRLNNCTLDGFVAGISWDGYADGNSAEDVEVGSNPTSGRTRIIYQRTNGDGTALINCKPYNAFLCDLNVCHGFVIEGCVGGLIRLFRSTGTIIAAHQETRENSSAIPWSIFLDRTHVTLQDFYSEPANDATHYTIDISDTVNSNFEATTLILDGWRPVTILAAASTDAAVGVDLHIVAMNPAGRIESRDSRGTINMTPTFQGPQGIRVDSADATIQTALDAGADHIASGDFVLSFDSAWRVGPLGDAPRTPVLLGTPTLAVAANTVITNGGLTNGTTYEYVIACKTAEGAYSPLSSAQSVAATSSEAINLTITNPTGPCTIAVWRKTGTGVTATPDHYIEIGLREGSTKWVDLGAHINGRTWQTSSIPTPTQQAEANVRRYVFPPSLPDQLSLLAVGQESFPRLLVHDGITLANQDVVLGFFTARKTETSTQLRVVCITGYTGAPSVVQFCLYRVKANGDRVQVGNTANDTSLLAAAQAYTKAWAAPIDVVAGNRYGVAALVVGATTSPVVAGISFDVGPGDVGEAPRIGGSLAGQLVLPSTIASGTLSGQSGIYAVILP